MERYSATPGFVLRSLLVTGPLLLWAVHFGAVYGVNTVVCSFFPEAGTGPVRLGPAQIGVAVATAAALLALALNAMVAGIAGRGLDERGPGLFLTRVTRGLAALSALAVIWNALPAALVQACW